MNAYSTEIRAFNRTSGIGIHACMNLAHRCGDLRPFADVTFPLKYFRFGSEQKTAGPRKKPVALLRNLICRWGRREGDEEA